MNSWIVKMKGSGEGKESVKERKALQCEMKEIYWADKGG